MDTSYQNGQNLSQRIYNEIKQKILHLDLKPGKKLSEMCIANMYGCSRIPVREAFRTLVLEGYLESRPQIGSFVPLINTMEFEHIRFIRYCLELKTLQIGLENKCYRSYIDKLQSLVDLQGEQYIQCQFVKAHQTDYAFHNIFYTAPNMEFVQAYSKFNNVNYYRIRFLSLSADPEPEQLVLQHQAILDAIKAEDPEALEVAVKMHSNNIYRVLSSCKEQFSSYFEDAENTDDLPPCFLKY